MEAGEGAVKGAEEMVAAERGAAARAEGELAAAARVTAAGAGS